MVRIITMKHILQHMRRLVLPAMLLLFSGCAETPEPLRFVTTFEEHHPESSSTEISQRTRMSSRLPGGQAHSYLLNEQSFTVHVPGAYRPQGHYGVLVWMPPDDNNVSLPPEWQPALDRHKLIAVVPHPVQAADQRNPFHHDIPLVLDAVHNINQQYSTDTNRIYIAGFSGSAIPASLIAFHFPDVFNGGIFIGEVGTWTDVTRKAISGKTRTYPAAFLQPGIRYFYQTQRDGRYVIIAGADSRNRRRLETVYRDFFPSNLRHCAYMEIRGMGDEMPDAGRLERAVRRLESL